MTEQLDALLADLPGPVVGVLRAAVDELAVEIGESPEAWRGVDILAHVVSAAIAMAGDIPPAYLITYTAALVAVAVDHPAACAARELTR